MWYAARGSHNESINHWRIGYATSPDGLNWTKYPEPVLETIGGWEGSDVANPSVLFDETANTYEMFYHGDAGIGRATSTDGISWTRDPDNPILTPTADTFDAKRVFNPYVLKKDGIYYMYYTGVGYDDKWQIGLATSELIPTPKLTLIPTETPTPSPTVSPTPTASPSPASNPTPTPTTTPLPTPTPSIFSPIVIVPGLGASWNPKDIFSCSLDSASIWEPAPYVTLYNRLIKTLTENAGLILNKDVFIYAYDWRKPLPQQATAFKNYLDNIRLDIPGDVNFRLIGHSLGGLVIRSYLTSYPVGHHIVSAMTVGTPHQGTLDAYPIWEKGEIRMEDLSMQIAVNQVINHCRIIRTFIPPKGNIFKFKFKTNREVVQYLLPVLRELLPTFDYLRENNQIKPVSMLKHQNDWLSQHSFPENLFGVSFYTLSGKNIPTVRFIDVKKPTIRESALGEWLDGKPVSYEKAETGDGTVLIQSSKINGAKNITMSGNHGDIIASDISIRKILDFLGLTHIIVAPATNIPEETSNNALTVSADKDTQLKVTDFAGKSSESSKNIIVAYEPSPGVYNLELRTLKNEEILLHLAVLDKKETPRTKDLSLKLAKEKTSKFYLVYNPANPEPLNLIPL